MKMTFADLIKNKDDYIGGKLIDNYIEFGKTELEENEITDIIVDNGFLKVFYKDGDKIGMIGGVESFASLGDYGYAIGLSLSCGCGSFKLYKKKEV